MRIHPDPVEIRKMVAQFRSYTKSFPNVKNVDMGDGSVGDEYIEPNFCGTPGCHAGLYSTCNLRTLKFKKGIKGFLSRDNEDLCYSDGGDLMAQKLFHAEGIARYHLQQWARENDHLWGNHSGYCMFDTSGEAFGVYGEEVSIDRICNWWEAVALRIEQLENPAPPQKLEIPTDKVFASADKELAAETTELLQNQ